MCLDFVDASLVFRFVVVFIVLGCFVLAVCLMFGVGLFISCWL